MPTIPYRTEFDEEAEKVAVVVRQARGGMLMNLDRLLLHSPQLTSGWRAFMTQARKRGLISHLHRELAICAVAAVSEGEYELHYHIPMLVRAGASQAQVDALADVAAAAKDTKLFDAAERAVLSLALESTRDVKVSEATLAAVKAAFPSPQEVLELTVIVAAYNMVARVNAALGVEIEERLVPDV